MRQVVLRFEESQIHGDGVDIIGPFTLSGGIDQTGTVSLVKSYTGKHQVLYKGNYDGEGTIYGRWSIEGVTDGPFVFHRDRENAANESITQIERSDL